MKIERGLGPSLYKCTRKVKSIKNLRGYLIKRILTFYEGESLTSDELKKDHKLLKKEFTNLLRHIFAAQQCFSMCELRYTRNHHLTRGSGERITRVLIDKFYKALYNQLPMDSLFK